MFERNLLKTIKDTALQSHHILQVCTPHPVLSTLPDNLELDSSFWTISPRRQIRVRNLPDNRQSLLFLVDSNFSTVKF